MRYIIFLFIIYNLFVSPAFAYNCPFGYVNAPFPGHCSLYIDQNNDNLCDNSQSPEALKINYTDSNNSGQAKTNYYIGQIILMFIIFQLTGISLVQYNKISKFHWRKINNFSMLISFIITLITSLIILLNLTSITQSSGLRTITWLHIESGLIMILFSIEHILRRWRNFQVRRKHTLKS